MILFYEKATGKIIGTIDGRVHPKEHLNMWVGDKNKTDRIVVQWEPIGKETIMIVEQPIFEEYVDDEGFTETRQVGTKKRKERSVEYEPVHKQAELFVKIEKKEVKIFDYKVDLKTKYLINK